MFGLLTIIKPSTGGLRSGSIGEGELRAVVQVAGGQDQQEPGQDDEAGQQLHRHPRHRRFRNFRGCFLYTSC